MTLPDETAGDGIDNDGNGYVDDHYGWDFDGNDNTTFDGLQDDHGTHVSGTIGAKGGNGKEVAGVDWSVTLISAKFLGRRGGTTANAVKAVDYITDLKTRDGLNIVATNNHGVVAAIPSPYMMLLKELIRQTFYLWRLQAIMAIILMQVLRHIQMAFWQGNRTPEIQVQPILRHIPMQILFL